MHVAVFSWERMDKLNRNVGKKTIPWEAYRSRSTQGKDQKFCNRANRANLCNRAALLPCNVHRIRRRQNGFQSVQDADWKGTGGHVGTAGSHGRSLGRSVGRSVGTKEGKDHQMI